MQPVYLMSNHLISRYPEDLQLNPLLTVHSWKSSDMHKPQTWPLAQIQIWLSYILTWFNIGFWMSSILILQGLAVVPQNFTYSVFCMSIYVHIKNVNNTRQYLIPFKGLVIELHKSAYQVKSPTSSLKGQTPSPGKSYHSKLFLVFFDVQNKSVGTVALFSTGLKSNLRLPSHCIITTTFIL